MIINIQANLQPHTGVFKLTVIIPLNYKIFAFNAHKKIKIMKNLTCLTVITAIILCSCSNPRFVNSPTVHNASFFRQKGDMKFSGAVSLNPSAGDKSLTGPDDNTHNTIGFDGQAAFALSDHFLIQADAMYRKEKDAFGSDDILGTDTRSKINYTRSLFDLGVGYYTAMGQSDRAYLNIVAGAVLEKFLQLMMPILMQQRGTAVMMLIF